MEHLVISTVKEIKKHEHPIAIYGAGELAVKIADYILECGGGIDAFAIDKMYATPEVRHINNIPVMSIEQFINASTDADLVIGFEGDWRKNLSTEILSKIHKIYEADFLGFLAMGNDNYITDKFLNKNKAWFEKINSLLEDDKSRKALDDFIDQKYRGTYSKDFDDERQYFDKEIIGSYLSDKECFVDCGAFKGETARTFIEFLAEQKIMTFAHIYSFEPDHTNVLEMRKQMSDLNNVDIIEAGVYKKSGKISFDAGQGSSSKISKDGANSIDVVSLDDYLSDKEPVTFIKMDIEGSELDALHGAEKLIKEYKPKLAICVYHKKEDLVDIPKYLISLDLGYKFYIRNYSLCGVETVLYAV